MKLLDDLLNGLWKLNPTFRIILGMCPTLAVTTAAVNSIAMGLSALFVLVGTAVIISLIRSVVPQKTRIPVFIVTIATFVTVADLFISAFFPAIHRVLGIYLPLVVVNCIILGRAEAFFSKNPLLNSIADAIGMGLGFTLGLLILGSVRELLGFGSLFGLSILPINPAVVMRLPAGAFITLGLLIAAANIISRRGSNA